MAGRKLQLTNGSKDCCGAVRETESVFWTGRSDHVKPSALSRS